ncbi:MAG: patatin, partial [Thiobacillus sp.]|nr:patatin [Thiobacillus sp.]
IALPGLFTPVASDGSWLVDGGLVNPVPVSLARAMGADFVIAVDLNTDLLGRHLKKAPATRTRRAAPTLADTVMAQLGIERNNGPTPPAMLDVLASSINIMQVLITRSRLAGEPADTLIAPSLAQLGLMEFHRAAVAIEAGRRATEAVLPQLRARLGGLYA